MILTPAQAKDLRPIVPEEIIPGGTFYLQEGREYHRCKFDDWELKRRGKEILRLSREKKGKLFIRSSAPWQPFQH